MVRWWCRLDGHPAGDPGSLAHQARHLGVQAWVVDLEVDAAGEGLPAGPLQDWLANANSNAAALAVAPMLQLRQPLSPHGEERLARVLAGWLQQPGSLRLCERPVLLLGDIGGFSHARFGPRRLRLSLQRELRRLGTVAPPWLVGMAMDDAWDSCVLLPRCEASSYRRHLQHAHHGPWPPGSWIPAVQAPQPHDGGSAALYGEWLEQAGAVSRCHWNGAQDAPVLLQSWLAHVQWWSPPAAGPAPAPAAAPSPSPPGQPPLAAPSEVPCLAWGRPDPQHLAVLVHGFYPDRLEDLLRRFPQPDGGPSAPAVDLYLSTPLQQLEPVAAMLRRQGWARVRLFGVENRGRDVAPFLLHLLPTALREGHELFLKLHTKRSSHLRDGEAWAEHLLGSLVSEGALRNGLEQLQQNPGLGLLAPAGTLMACSVALQANVDHLLALCARCGVSPASLLQHRFIAGSMMAGRLQALAPLCQLELELMDFEPEQGQTDGTLAHALERWLCCSAAEGGWQLQDLPGEACAVPGFGHRVSPG
jgi:hypothetical protein